MKTESYRQGVALVNDRGESVKEILGYWLPEVITSTILYSITPIMDAYFVAQLGSLTTFGALGVASNILHTLIKIAEGIPAASVAMIGKANGAKEYDECGTLFASSFLTTFMLGFSQFLIIIFFSRALFGWLNVPAEMITIGVPFLQLKSAGIFLVFISLALISFIKAVKNTHVPMLINLLGIFFFVICDYALILGRLGFKSYGLTGSALATIIQYGLINIISLGYILYNPDYRKYFKAFFVSLASTSRIKQLLLLGSPIMIDKASFALAYVWLSKMVAPMGTAFLTSYDIILRLERFAFLPAIAFGQIIVFLVSNRLGARDKDGSLANIKKCWFLGVLLTSVSLITLSFFADYFVQFFDPRQEISHIVVPAIRIISLFVIFDITQIILAGGLRGAHDVNTVMSGRIIALLGFFVPISYLISITPFADYTTKLTVMYSTFYLTTGLMGIFYLWRIKGNLWYTISADKK